MMVFSSGSRTVNFTIPANSRTAILPSNLMLLTGTVAGTVHLTANIDNGPTDVPVATVEVLLTAPQITNVTAARRTSGIDVQITGYVPARRVTTVDFTFDVKNGNTTQRVTLSRNVEANFGGWFSSPGSTPYGGSFSYIQSFNIEGDSSVIQSVTVRLVNAQGSTTSAIVQVP
jgi:hypothetical protein